MWKSRGSDSTRPCMFLDHFYFILFTGRESKRTCMTDGIKKWEIKCMLRVYICSNHIKLSLWRHNLLKKKMEEKTPLLREWDLKSGSPNIWNLDKWLPFCQTIWNPDKTVHIWNGPVFEWFGLEIAETWPFENLTIWNPTFKMSGFQLVGFLIPTVRTLINIVFAVRSIKKIFQH